MALLQIPLRNDLDHFEFSIDLEGRAYTFEIMWNERAGYWSLILKNTAGEVLVGAVPLRVNSNLLQRFAMAELPPGSLFLYDQSGRNMEAGKSDLGTRCVLLYRERMTV